MSIEDNTVLELSAKIVAAYVYHNRLPVAELPYLLERVHLTIASFVNGRAESVETVSLSPAVPIKKSITPDFIICLEDGKKFKSMKRHLGSIYNMTPDEYRKKWGLPRDYPMVAPMYSAARSHLAKESGLGVRGTVVPKERPAAASSVKGRKVRRQKTQST